MKNKLFKELLAIIELLEEHESKISLDEWKKILLKIPTLVIYNEVEGDQVITGSVDSKLNAGDNDFFHFEFRTRNEALFYNPNLSKILEIKSGTWLEVYKELWIHVKENLSVPELPKV